MVAVDGKTLRGAHDRGKGKGMLALVSASARASRLTLGQVTVDVGANEITVIPALLKHLILDGCIVTIGAIGCQTAIAQQIVNQEADHVLVPKENQAWLCQAVRRRFAVERARSFAGLSTMPTGGGTRATGASNCVRRGRRATRP